MMRFVWSWLAQNSAQIQALAGIAAVLVASIVGWVAWMQKTAAEAQAAAAAEQTTAAKQQASAASEQVTAARQETRTSFLIADIQTSPHISLTQAQTYNGILLKGQIAILNNGSGVADNLRLRYRDGLPGNEVQLSTISLVVRDSVSAIIDEHRAAQSGLLLTYTTIFGTKCSLEFEWNGQISRAFNQKLTTEYALQTS